MSLLDPRLWLVALAILAGSSGLSYFNGRTDGARLAEAKHAQATVLANDEARRLEQARQRRADEAAKLARAREAGIRAAADRARGESAGLRDDLSAARDYAKKSRDAAERTAALATDLLGRCEARYLGMAEAAARADSYARELMEAWPP